MRKNIYLVILCLLLFVSCDPKENEDTSNTSVVTPEPTVEPVPSVENTAWIEAYADFLMQNDCSSHFILFDVDFDDIPEMFFYVSGYGANMWVTTILSFSKSGIKQTDIEEQLPAQFELYKDKQTDEMRWVAVMNAFRSSFTHYHYEWTWIDFNDISDIRTKFFFKWDLESVITNPETNEYEEFHYLFVNENEMVESEYEEIKRRRQELFSTYELIKTKQLYYSIDDFIINEDAKANADKLDRGLIIESLLQYESDF